jgi:hypothetical protein
MEVGKEENHADNSCPHFYLYVPGKLDAMLPNESFTSSVVLPEKNPSDGTTCNGNNRFSRPINLFSSEFRKIATDLKKMHSIWSNID